MGRTLEGQPCVPRILACSEVTTDDGAAVSSVGHLCNSEPPLPHLEHRTVGRTCGHPCVRAAQEPTLWPVGPQRPAVAPGGENVHTSKVRSHFPTSKAALGAFPEPAILMLLPFVRRLPPPPSPPKA